LAERSSGLSAAKWLHLAASFSPIAGKCASQSGGEDREKADRDKDRDWAFSEMALAFPTIVTMASVIGMRTISRRAIVSNATAKPLFFTNLFSSFSRTGHVAITIRPAQIIETKKGLRTQKVDTMSTPMESTDRVVWVMSRGTGSLARICGFLLLKGTGGSTE
jgi:hypothetical protein